MIQVVWNVIKSVFCFILRIFSPLKRLICRRKRRDSDTILPLANHYSIPEDFTSIPSSQPDPLQSWDTWDADDNKQKSTQNGPNYGNMNQRQISQEESEPEPDYFQDMMPTIKRQKKVFIGGNQNQAKSTNLFAVSNDVPLATGSQLETWDESQQGWEGETMDDISNQAEAELREQRRQERFYQQQKKKQERDSLRGLKKDKQLTAVKLS